jgi:eukaryotic-like serine/threonine-protein kinase
VAMTAGSRVRTIGRYALHDEIASGGMATVHFGRLLGQAGFTRTVAIKRLHAQYAKDPEFAAMFMDEARLAARIHHPNVVATLDVVARDGELFLVMEYVPGESLSKLVKYAARQGEPIEPRIAVTIVAGFLHGLHAAHEARSERGEPLELVHRDVSPQNVLVGADGVPRVVDFGVAKAIGRVQSTREGQLKGKLSYMSPEQIQGLEVNRRSDVYAASIILWELLAERRLFDRESDAAVMLAVIAAEVVAPSTYAPGVPARLDRITLRGLARNPEERYRSALDMALDLEDAIPLALPSELGRWAQSIAGASLSARATRVTEIESSAGLERQLPSDNPSYSDSGELRTIVTAGGPETPSPDPPSPDATAPDPPVLRHGSPDPASPDSTAPDAPPETPTSPDGLAPPAYQRLGLAVAVGLSLTLLLGFAFLPHAQSTPERAAVPAVEATAPAPPVSALPVEEAPVPPTEATVEMEFPANDPPPAAGAFAAPKEPATREAPRSPSSAPAAPAHAAKRPLPPKCDPPYRIDASGHKIFIMECL